MQRKARTDIQRLEKTLADFKAKYEMVLQPSQLYIDGYKAVVESVRRIATLYFSSLPEKAIEEPVSTSKKLGQIVPSVQIPVANTEYSRVLRLACVQHHIFGTICQTIWRAFFSRYLEEQNLSTLPRIHEDLRVYGDDVQRHWRVSTLKVLDQLDKQVDVGKFIDVLIDDKIVLAFRCLLDDNQVNPFKRELKSVFTRAIELDRMARNDQSPVYVDNIPSSDHEGWKEYWSESDEGNDMDDPVVASPTMKTQSQPLLVSPRFYRRATRTAGAAVGTVELEVIQPGFALFPDTGIFKLGAFEYSRIKGAGSEVARGDSGSLAGRKQSLSTSITGMGIMQSPTMGPSKMWSREGVPAYD